MLNFIYYPVSFILWVWHKAFGFLLGPDSGLAWALSVMFLVFTLRAILYKPFVHQVRSMRRMQEFQPEIAKLRKKYANDRQKQAEEMQRLQKDHGVNPLGGCLPVLVQVPVFIGLFHVLREFGPLTKDGLPRTENYFFGLSEVESFNRSSLFGAKLGNWVLQGEEFLNAAGTSVASMIIVMIPLMIAAGVFTHITARHSVARQTAAQAENPQTAIMNRLMLYVFPIGVVVGAPFLPLAVLLYWVSNNLWTLGQQYVVYKRIDVEESAKREQAAVTRQARAPRPGQKPVRPEATPDEEDKPAKRPGAKPVMRKKGADGASANGATPGTNGGSAPAAKDGAADAAEDPAEDAVTNSATNSATNGATDGAGAGSSQSRGARSARSGGSSRPPARRPRKRR
ncbi:membrane protein insertase YidC [Pseudonocardia sp. MH-G8]|uniref:membrane protein insertase YidC n=1 Tax=Pseudonocardia sp. MH-G8 TaxID=1854588 RepID=UPI000BA156D5|nr:membrane protein insertase YidC [Pseudonocardia sp. MH-G8]OZM82427.1 membrane protein insertase YidC [Pseudonocardia sp. MH-G8]